MCLQSGGRGVQGSSPLARGLLPLSGGKWIEERIIPARAGFTAATLTTTNGTRDHPRSRGVYLDRRCVCVCQFGSSPLARGLRADRRVRHLCRGIIPARAGFTPWPRVAPHILQDHPRSRGVYPGESGVRLSYVGSSPLARGLQAPATRLGGRGRIIPARAGFTGAAASASSNVRDHPRSRGVYERKSLLAPESPGSSPLARGLPRHRRATSCRQEDHPRSRGVYWVPLRRPARTYGIIPARAGFTRAEERL